MPTPKPNAIALKDLESRLSAAVAGAVKANPALKLGAPEIGYHPDPGIIGFILKDKDIFAANARSLKGVAAAIAKEAGGLGEPATVIYDKKILMGYFPRDILRIGR